MNAKEAMGKLVKFNVCLVKSRARIESGKWRRYYLRASLTEMKTGWIVGFRTYQEGVISYRSYDFGDHEYQCTSTIKCALVATSPYQNPFKVDLSDLNFI